MWFNHGLSTVGDALSMLRSDPIDGVVLWASHRDKRSPVFKMADHAFVEPHFDVSTTAGRESYLQFCLETCASRKIDVFIVQGNRVAIADHAATFAAIGARLVVAADARTLELVNDKAQFYHAALARGLPMPWTAEVSTAEQFDAAIDQLRTMGLDACVKPPKGVFGAGFWRLVDDLPLFDTLMLPDNRVIARDQMRRALSASEGRRLLVLEHLPGVEWSVDCLCDRGRLLCGVGRRKLGRAQLLETEGRVIDLARSAVESFGLSGLVNVQFKAATKDGGDPRLLEINARMSGGCLYTQFSGVNLPWWQLALLLGHRREVDMPMPVGGAVVGSATSAFIMD